MYKYKNIKAFESTISGVFAFNTPIGKETKLPLEKEGDNFDFYSKLDQISNMIKDLSNLDVPSLELLLDNDNEWIKENINLITKKLEEVHNFAVPQIDDADIPNKKEGEDE